uniref:GTP-binding protein 1 n=1 Tax=Clandestinovirus TaxID=2831644 RepID=A0A8F8KL03_9VIRU|nr:GTP-binding protein 1 [Clandestinovirus]
MDRKEMSSSLSGLLTMSTGSQEDPERGLPDEVLQRFSEFQFQVQNAITEKGEEFFKFEKSVDGELGPKDFLDALVEEDDSLHYERFGTEGVHFWRTSTSVEWDEKPPVRLLIMGNVDSSKSTTISVLTDPSNSLDDGRGSARERIMKHKHEIESGRTSMTTSYPYTFTGSSGYEKQMELVDVAGHEKYLKSAAKGATKYMPDYALLLVEATSGLTRMTKEHLMLAMSLQLPLIITITKMDMVQEKKRLDETLDELKLFMKRMSSRKIMIRVSDETSLCTALDSIYRHANGCIPLFCTSNVTGQGVDHLKRFIGHLPSRIRWQHKEVNLVNGTPLFIVEQSYSVAGVGLVVGGICASGSLKENEKAFIGPFGDGRWEAVRMRSLHHRRKPVKVVLPGQSAGIALKSNLTRDDFRHGVLLSTTALQCYRRIKTKVRLFGTLTVTMTNGYAPMLECTFFRQVAKVVSVQSDKSELDGDAKKQLLRAGDSGTVIFQTMYRPIYVQVGMRFLIREGKIRGLGIVEELLE